MYLKTGDPGMSGGGTYTSTDTNATLDQYANIFGPAGRDIKLDQQRHKRHQRWHLPDALKGHNQYLTDRVDGLITDATNSPFTRNILPYVYLENPDQKLKWNVYSFDEGIASRVPYEAAARVLPQSKRSFAGYTVRQGLAIAMEHNFMVSAAGRENFKNQLTQLVGSIQLTNDLDVHVALLQAPSHQKHMNEKYYDNSKTTPQICRQYIDLFGILQKIPNAMDILIEDAKSNLQTWGSQPPTFVLCNSALTTQLTMLPEKTNFLTNGPDGLKRLAQGPDLSSYRGLSIIPSRKFSMDAGTAPRDLLRRRVRVAEYYRIPYDTDNHKRQYEFYDQSRDTMFTLSYADLLRMSNVQSSNKEVTYRPESDDWETDSLDDARVQRYQTYITSDQMNLAGHRGARTAGPPGVTSWIPGTLPLHRSALCLRGRSNGLGYRELLLHGISRSKDPAKRKQPKSMPISQILKSCEVENKILSAGQTYIEEMCYKDDVKDLCTQSETFGRGVFSDPIEQTLDQKQRILRNFDSLVPGGTSNDFAKTWIVAHLFDELEQAFDKANYSNKALLDGISKGEGFALADTHWPDNRSVKSTNINRTMYNDLSSHHMTYLLADS